MFDVVFTFALIKCEYACKVTKAIRKISSGTNFSWHFLWKHSPTKANFSFSFSCQFSVNSPKQWLSWWWSLSLRLNAFLFYPSVNPIWGEIYLSMCTHTTSLWFVKLYSETERMKVSLSSSWIVRNPPPASHDISSFISPVHEHQYITVNVFFSSFDRRVFCWRGMSDQMQQ